MQYDPFIKPRCSGIFQQKEVAWITYETVKQEGNITWPWVVGVDVAASLEMKKIQWEAHG